MRLSFSRFINKMSFIGTFMTIVFTSTVSIGACMAVVFFYIIPLVYRYMHRLENRINNSILNQNNVNAKVQLANSQALTELNILATLAQAKTL